MSNPYGGPQRGDFKLLAGGGLARSGVWRALSGPRCSGPRAAGARLPAGLRGGDRVLRLVEGPGLIEVPILRRRG
jgi:hypothetical protein